jgi:hypothetical protein
VQPRDVLGRISIRCVCQSLSDENGVLDPLELLSSAEVPDGRNPSGSVLGEVVLRENRVRRDGVRESIDQLLDRGTPRARAVPEVE